MEADRALDRPLRKGADAERVEDRLRDPVPMSARPEDGRWPRAVRATVQAGVRGPRARELPPAEVLVHDVVEEERVEVVPLEPRCGPFQIAGWSVPHEQSVTGEREGEPVPFPRQEETRILTHRLRRRKGSRGM